MNERQDEVMHPLPGPGRVYIGKPGASPGKPDDWIFLGTIATCEMEMVTVGTPQPVTWHLAICGQCQPPLPQPFLTEADRERWTHAHVIGTRHHVRYATEIGP